MATADDAAIKDPLLDRIPAGANREPKRDELLIVAATAVGILMNFVGIDPIKALFDAAFINGLAAPPLLVLIVLLTSARALGPDHPDTEVARRNLRNLG